MVDVTEEVEEDPARPVRRRRKAPFKWGGVAAGLAGTSLALHKGTQPVVPYRVVSSSEVTLGYKLMRTYVVGPLGP